MTIQTTIEAETEDRLAGIFPLRRPATLAACARIGARRYRRERDLPGAVPGLLAGEASAILPRLIDEEHRCEQDRRARSAAWRPAQHVQILSALLAEAAAFEAREAATEIVAMPLPLIPKTDARSPARGTARPAGRPPRTPQAKASGSEALRLTT